VCSAGSSELPSRKAGGIRGLLSGRVTPLLSRRESEEIAQGEVARRALQSGGNGGKGGRNGLATVLPMGMEQTTTLRTRGLRENVAR
jgi:hypothetical protein